MYFFVFTPLRLWKQILQSKIYFSLKKTFQITKSKRHFQIQKYLSNSDGRGPSSTSSESPPTCHIGPITRAMARKLQEDWNTATDGRETYLYMLKTP